MGSINLKSELFSTFDPKKRENDEFTSDMKRLLDLWSDDTKRDLFKNELAGIILTKTNLEEKAALENLADAISESWTTTSDAMKCVMFVLGHFISKKGRMDQPADLVSDMTALRLIGESTQTSATALLEWVKNDLLPKVEPELRRRGAASGLFPSLKGISVDVELKAVQIDKYTTEQKVEDYTPNITEIVPVASIEIRTTGDDFVFQGDKGDLTVMINHLQAAIKDLEALENLTGREDK